MKYSLRIVLLACTLLVCDPIIAADVYGINFPKTIAGFTLDSVINNEKDTPGQGYSLLYDHPGVKASVFVYNLGIDHIPDGDSSAVVRKAFQQALSDVKTVHPDAQSMDATPRLSANGVGLLHAAFQYKTLQLGTHDVVVSQAYMTAQGGNFILVRTDYSVLDQPTRGMRVERAFMEALCKVLADSSITR